MLRTITQTPASEVDDGSKPSRSVSIVIPCLNEEDSVENLFEQLANLEASIPGYEFFYIVVDDGSTDNSVVKLLDVFESVPNFLLIQHGENCGIAAAITSGIEAARTEIVASMDFDCTYDPVQFRSLLPLIRTADVVTASPYHPLGKVLNVPQWRFGDLALCLLGISSSHG